MLELIEVTKTVQGRPHIHPMTLTLERATMNVLLGPTLAGKTTLMRLMAGLDKPQSGRIVWDGVDVTGMRVQDRHVAMVYQQFINYPAMSVYDNIASPLRLMRRNAASIDAAVRETAAMLKLTDMLDRRPLELSGGQQQRCALARALVKGAGLVLLDEPLANLDYKLREELRSEIPRIFAESGAIFVYATTEPEEALLLGGNTAALSEGRLTQFGPTATVYRNPVDLATALVFSNPPMNFIAVVKSGEQLLGDAGGHAAPQGMSGLRDGRYRIGFRGNHLRLGAGALDMLVFEARVVVTEITGSETFLHLDHAGARWVALIDGVHHLKPGTTQTVHVDPAHVYAFGEDGRLAAAAPYAKAA